ncbi:MAG: restriction endonuclease subunit S [Candidatus Electrothrix sp. ATG2]|nr:restriction endonuclease subunit S [Candidatus Electrothrix sp. ATG2]
MQRFETYSEYKDSGVDWLGSVPAGWEVKRLKYLGNIRYGLGQPPKEKNDGLRLIRATNVERGKIVEKGMIFVDPADIPWDRDPELKENDIIVVRSGAYTGDSAIVPAKYNNAIAGYDMVFTPTNALPQFVAFSFLSQYVLFDQLYLLRMRAAQPHLNAEELGETLIFAPPISVQQAIVDFLEIQTTKIDTAITQKKQMIALLKERKQLLIQNAVTKGIDPAAKMKDSGVEWIGEIPEGWQVKRGKFLFTEVDERSVDGQEELLSVSHMTGVTPRSEKKVSMFMAEDYTGSKTCMAGDLIYNIMWAWMGALGVANQAGIVSPSYGVYRRNDDHTLNTKFIELLLKSTQYVAYYNKVSTGLHSSRLRFYSHMFFNMEIAFPPLAEQEDIIQHIETQSAKIDTSITLQQQQITKLKEYKSILIDHAVTGKIKVA